ncbi:MAG: peptidylprolyl isomerase, partial [Candidatus Nitrosopumilus limneticus]|nr:peptidylprolyl isomerase [Candidatus Nitrosopumilus limneticus]MDC4216090.1 peptidylprolyl isomerase [Candidatus Nitrosopumilus limneticus]
MIRVVFTFIFILLSIGLVNLVDAAIYNDPVIIIQTNQGDIVIEFFIADAENHVTNFIQLSRDGFYDGTLFHRIIPGFMIQGGDPNTINGNPDTWGQGGPDKKLNQEFNSIKHNRGIVSMARSADPNSAGSQFFIIHKNSNFLDGEYTAFGRIATEESFRTLDRIAAVQTETNDRPVDPEQVRIIKTAMVNRDSVLGIIDYVEPERTGSSIKEVTDNQIFESEELGISFSPPEGWLLQQPDQSTIGAPDVAAVGPKTDGVNPVISLTIENAANKTIDDLIKEKNNLLDAAITSKQLEILSQKLIRTNVYQTEAIGNFQVDDKTLKIKFIDVIILSEEKSYTFAYNNLLDNFDNEITKFNKSLDSFKILSQDNTIMEISTETLDEEKGGGCLIATATYGSELAPQVQLLREIRDNSLLNTESGTVFMKTFNEFYYSFSPTIA